jgi:hypothetical protein
MRGGTGGGGRGVPVSVVVMFLQGRLGWHMGAAAGWMVDGSVNKGEA